MDKKQSQSETYRPRFSDQDGNSKQDDHGKNHRNNKRRRIKNSAFIIGRHELHEEIRNMEDPVSKRLLGSFYNIDFGWPEFVFHKKDNNLSTSISVEEEVDDLNSDFVLANDNNLSNSKIMKSKELNYINKEISISEIHYEIPISPIGFINNSIFNKELETKAIHPVTFTSDEMFLLPAVLLSTNEVLVIPNASEWKSSQVSQDIVEEVIHQKMTPTSFEIVDHKIPVSNETFEDTNETLTTTMVINQSHERKAILDNTVKLSNLDKILRVCSNLEEQAISLKILKELLSKIKQTGNKFHKRINKSGAYLKLIPKSSYSLSRDGKIKDSCFKKYKKKKKGTALITHPHTFA